MYHAVPKKYESEDTVEGLIIKCDGFAEKHMTQLFYDYKKAVHASFLKLLACVPRVFSILDTKGKPQSISKASGDYKIKAIAVALAKATDRAAVKAFVEETLIPGIVEIGGSNLKEEARPTWNDETSYKIVKSFNAIFSDEECCHYVKYGYCVKKGKKDWKFLAPKQFFHASKGNVYSVWPVGQVPAAIIKEYKLKDKNLHAQDSKRLPARLSQKRS